MERVRKHLHIGRRWLLKGWQLFMLNPWLLGGMGLTASMVLGVLEGIPLLGGLLIALVAPAMLSSVYLSLDTIYRHHKILPTELRLPALKQSPIQLLHVFWSEQRILPAVAACVFSVSVVLLIHLLLRLVAGEAWVADWASLDTLTRLGMLGMGLLAALCYILLAATLIYALPLTFLRGEPLMPSLRQSIKASRHFTVALSLILGVLLLPLLLSLAAAEFSSWMGYLLWVVTGTVTLPLVAAALFCSYQDIFRTRDAWIPADRRRRSGDTVTVEKNFRPF